MFVGVPSACLSVCVPCACRTHRGQNSVRFSGSEVVDGCGLPDRCWEFNPDLPSVANALNHRAIIPVPILAILKF